MIGNYAWNKTVSEVLMGGGAGSSTPCTLPEAGGTGWAVPGGSPEPIPATIRTFLARLARSIRSWFCDFLRFPGLCEPGIG
jgi:hypothetical protein